MKQRKGQSMSPSHHDKANGNGPTANPAGITSFKLMLLVMMVLQNSSTVLVGRYTRGTVPKDEQCQVTHLILVIELGKLLASLVLEFHTTGGKLMQSLQTHVMDKPMDALKITIPALLYLFQNTLLYVALENLTAPMFQVTYQMKLVTTAILSVFMLNRKYSAQQWVCLVCISLGVAMVVLGEKKGDDDAASSKQELGHTNLLVGLGAVTIACLSSAMAGVYFEKVLKKPEAPSGDSVKTPPASLWMRNIQLAFYSVCIAAVQCALNSSSVAAAGQGFLHGFNFWTWVLVILQAGGGLLVAAVIKYADNVLKGLATGVSVVLSSGLSMLLFSTPLGMKFVIGGCLILTAVWFFSNPLPEKVGKSFNRKDSEFPPSSGNGSINGVAPLLPK